MRKVLAWLGGIVVVLVVAFALSFGGTQALASGSPAPSFDHCSQFCPGNDQACNDCCQSHGTQGGQCVGDGCACEL